MVKFKISNRIAEQTKLTKFIISNNKKKKREKKKGLRWCLLLLNLY